MSFDGSLKALIPDIEHVCHDLRNFKAYLRTAAHDIPALLYEFNAIIDFLRRVQEVSRDPRNVYDSERYSSCVVDVVTAIRGTLKDITRHLARANQIPIKSRKDAAGIAWEDLLDFFWDQGYVTLLERLNIFKGFLRELWPILDGARETQEFDRLHQRIIRLLDIQKEDLVRELRQLELERAHLSPLKSRSFEKKRPVLDTQADLPPPRVPAPPPAFAKFRPGPDSPSSPPGAAAFHPADLARPITPPSSVVFTGESSVASGPSVTYSDMFRDHWINDALTADRPCTEFYETGSESVLIAEHTSGVLESLSKNSYKLLMKFHYDNIHLGFYLRPKDRKICLYCKYQKGDKKTVACNPISKLRVLRDGSTLKLCHIKDKKHMLWVGIRFSSYEKLVLFFTAILALKMDEQTKIPFEINDHEIQGEKHIFSATILEDQYRHALQIYKDKCSDGIRILVSVRTGEMKRTPVWVSFINYKISSRLWIKKVEPRKVHLKDLPRYVFMTGFTPRVGANDMPELLFDNAREADKFVQIIDDLAEGHFDEPH